MPGHLIRRLHQRSAAVFQDRMRLAAYDITSVQYAALVTLLEHPGIDQATLADLIAYDRATIGGVVQRLEQKCLVEREVDKQDRRARRLRLTKVGKLAINALSPVVHDLQDEILARLTNEERKLLLQLIGKAIAD